MDAAPTICHTQARDGTRLAYSTIGAGPALVLLFPYHVNDLVRNWSVPVHRQAMRFLAGRFTVINLDLRGAGQSERDVEPLSLDALSGDVLAVIADAGHVDAAVLAMGNAAPVAAHLARTTTSVSRLVFLEAGESETSDRIFELQAVNPPMGADLRASAIVGNADGENSAALASVMREAVAAPMLADYLRVLKEAPLEPLLRTVRTPTLVVHGADDELIPLDVARRLTEWLPDAHLMPVPVRSGFAVWRQQDAVDRIAAFAAGTWSGAESDAPPPVRGRSPADRVTGDLTQREREVLDLVASGMTNQQIAGRLFISLNTVSHHLRSIFAKTGSRNRTEAAAHAHRSTVPPAV